ncbi:unnamed protein product [Durusdinium trenchii]|uniref:Uncharacterized protein n=2 Tax=Durusdinium trenchii TaxID=1381693 RepID=A0ABP0SXP1_9DINO
MRLLQMQFREQMQRMQRPENSGRAGAVQPSTAMQRTSLVFAVKRGISKKDILKKRSFTRSDALQKLQDALQQFSKEDRYKALHALPQAVKTALLVHMEHVKTGGVSGTRSLTSQAPGDSGVSLSPKRKTLCRRAVSVHRKRGGWVARLNVLPYLSVATRCTQTPEQATAMLKVLQRAKELALQAATCEADAVYEALRAACREHRMALSDLALSFCASVGAESLVGCSISGKYSTSLEDVLVQRHLLLEGRTQGWPQLRKACLKVMQASVQPRSGVFGRACPKAMAEAEAERLAQVLDDKRRALCQKRLEKAFRDAVKLVELVLRKQEQQVSRKRSFVVAKSSTPVAF